MDDGAFHRRAEDRDRELNARLETLERRYQDLEKAVTGLDATVNLLKVEQKHAGELFDARLRGIEKGQELHTSKLDGLAALITTMASDPDKSPAGKALVAHIADVEGRCAAQAATIEELTKWQTRIDGAFLLVKFTGWSGLIALIVLILRALNIIPGP